MKNFFLSIWPETVPSEIRSSDETDILRERILQTMLFASSIVGLIVTALVASNYIQNQHIPLLVLYAVVTVLMIILAFSRRIRYSLRAASIVTLFYLIALGSLLTDGLSGNGPLLMAIFTAISAIFMGFWMSVATGGLALASVLTVGFLMSQNIISAPSNSIQANATNMGEWLIRSVVITLVSIFFTVTLTILVNGLRRSLTSQKQLTQELTVERDTLEAHVQQRTVELERRTLEMETASQIAKEISTTTDLDELLKNAVELIKREYHLYYAAIFLVDEHREFAVLRSGTGEAGAQMMVANHKLQLAESSMVGYAILKNEIRLVQDVDQDLIHYKNPMLPETLSEMALPLVVSGVTIGALDVQSEKLRFFMPADIRVLQVAADQLAVAIDKARVLQELTQTLEDLRANFRQTTQESWQGFMRLSRRSFNYQYHQGKVEPGGTSSEQANEALSLGTSVVANAVSPETGKFLTTVAIPIKLRDHVLGVIDLKFETQAIPPHLIETLDAVANRLALALENTRLLEEIRMRADRDRLVSNISSKVRAEADVDKVLQTVALELGRSLSVSGVVVQLRSAD